MPDTTMDVPGSPESPDWDSMYLYRGDEEEEARPIFTGDVFLDAEVQEIGGIGNRNVIVVQHPCALRVDGVNLVTSLVVAEVVPGPFHPVRNWQGHYRIMPLPNLLGDHQNYEVSFLSLFLCIPDSLDLTKRVASLSLVGVNLLLQRWVKHNSRATIPAWQYAEVTTGAYEEADAIEEWCAARAAAGVDVAIATAQAAEWLDGRDGGVPRRRLLDDPQRRSDLRKQMRTAAQGTVAPGATRGT
jgi:hypothetical protein